MGKIRVAGTAELISMALGSNFVRPADHPRIFGRAVFAELCEEFFKAGFELTGDAVTLEAQWHITGRRHVLVYALEGAAREPWRAGVVVSFEKGRCWMACIEVVRWPGVANLPAREEVLHTQQALLDFVEYLWFYVYMSKSNRVVSKLKWQYE